MARKIMVVDDEPQIRELLRIFLTKKGFDVCQAPDARAALDMMAADATIDLVILDNRMPGLQGSDIVDRLKNIKSEVKVVLLTGSITSTHKDLMIDAFMRKPVDLNKLLETVEQALGRV
jgi:DNA-binding NtrC family response regulator